MPYCQILVTSANNNSYIPIPGAMGRFNVKLLSLQFHSTTGGGVHPTVQVQSDKLVFQYSSSQYFTFISNASTNLTLDNCVPLHIGEIFFDGKIFINCIDTTTGSAPAGFTQLLINLSLEDKNTKLVL